LKKSFIVVISVAALARFAEQSLLRSGFDVLGLPLDSDARSQTRVDDDRRRSARPSVPRSGSRATHRSARAIPTINQSNQIKSNQPNQSTETVSHLVLIRFGTRRTDARGRR